MKYLRQLSIILLIYFLGEIIKRAAHIPIPGSVLGMLILLVALCTGIIKLEHIEDVSKFLLDHLAFFFLPAGVGVLAYINLIKEAYIPILLVCFISTVMVMGVTGLIVQGLKGSGKDERVS